MQDAYKTRGEFLQSHFHCPHDNTLNCLRNQSAQDISALIAFDLKYFYDDNERVLNFAEYIGYVQDGIHILEKDLLVGF